VTLSNKQRVFVETYVRTWNATQSAIAAGYPEQSAYSQGSRLLKNVEVKAEIALRLEDLTMSPAEVLARLTNHARGDMGVFFKVTDEWVEFPLPSYEVVDAKEVPDPDDEGETKTFYLVRHVTIDLEKLMDPRYSHLIRKFSDSAKNGLSVELYDAQAALKLLGQQHGLFKEKVEVSGNVGVQVLEVVKDYGPTNGD
jgi:hypothetical protein